MSREKIEECACGDYQECSLEKHVCLGCGNEFIVGTEMLNGKRPYCPYCKSGNAEKVAWTDSSGLQGLPDLGCLSLMKPVADEPEKGENK